MQVDEIEALQSDLSLGTRWLTQMGEAARRCGLTIQYCMSQPRHLLTAINIPAVTQVLGISILTHTLCHSVGVAVILHMVRSRNISFHSILIVPNNTELDRFINKGKVR